MPDSLFQAIYLPTKLVLYMIPAIRIPLHVCPEIFWLVCFHLWLSCFSECNRITYL